MLALKVKIGIHPGSAPVGTLGNDLRVEFNAVGVTVNLASKMEALADSGTIFVREENFNPPLRPDPRTGIFCGQFTLNTQCVLLYTLTLKKGILITSLR